MERTPKRLPKETVAEVLVELLTRDVLQGPEHSPAELHDLMGCDQGVKKRQFESGHEHFLRADARYRGTRRELSFPDSS